MYRSTDGGESWTAINEGLTDLDITALTIASDGSAVYAGTDGGESWTAINEGLTDLDITALAIASDGSGVYAGTDASGAVGARLTGDPISTAAIAAGRAPARLFPGLRAAWPGLIDPG